MKNIADRTITLMWRRRVSCGIFFAAVVGDIVQPATYDARMRTAQACSTGAMTDRGKNGGSRVEAVLLVKDSENDIELTLLSLQKAGLENPVDVVHDGVEALEYLRCEGMGTQSLGATPT